MSSFCEGVVGFSVVQIGSEAMLATHSFQRGHVLKAVHLWLCNEGNDVCIPVISFSPWKLHDVYTSLES